MCRCLFCVVTENSFIDDAEQETYLTAYVWRNWVSTKKRRRIAFHRRMGRMKNWKRKESQNKNTMECTDFARVTTLTWLILTQLIDRKHRRRKNIINGIWLFFFLFHSCGRPSVRVCVILVSIFYRHNDSEPSAKNGRIIKSGRLNNTLECDYSYAGDIVLTQIFLLFFDVDTYCCCCCCFYVDSRRIMMFMCCVLMLQRHAHEPKPNIAKRRMCYVRSSNKFIALGK